MASAIFEPLCVADQRVPDARDAAWVGADPVPADPIIRLIRRVFLEDRPAGILFASSIQRERRERVLRYLGLSPSEVDVLWVQGVTPLLLLTTSGIVLPRDGVLAMQIRFDQVSHASRALGTLHIHGHADQVTMVPGLTVDQARILVAGINKVVAELAGDKDRDGGPEPGTRN